MSFRVVMYILILISLNEIESQQSVDSGDGKAISALTTPEEIFMNDFIQRRVEQLTAVKKLQVTENAVDQYKMISIMAQKLFGIVQETKEVLDEIGIYHGASELPKDLQGQEVLTHFLENTALLCDFLIFIPDATKRLLSFNFRWRILLIDSIEFASSLKFLDGNTLKQLQQAANILSEFEETNFSSHNGSGNKKKKKERKKVKRGPRLSSGSSSGEF